MPPRNFRFASLVIVSGGQTGADRAALDWAIAHGVAHGGWCPNGRRAEDGVLAEHYRLTETPSQRYSQRTEWNVRDSDATLIVSVSPQLTGGSRSTREFARAHAKPCLHVSGDAAPAKVRRFLAKHRVRVLNIAGPRASKEPDVYELVIALLDQVFPRARARSGEQVVHGPAKLTAS
jgi:hypothetical protein